MSTIVGFYAGAESDYRRNQIAASFRDHKHSARRLRPPSAPEGPARPRGLVRRVSTAAAWVLRELSEARGAEQAHRRTPGQNPRLARGKHRDHRPAGRSRH